MSSGRSLPHFNLGVLGEIQGDSHTLQAVLCPKTHNPIGIFQSNCHNYVSPHRFLPSEATPPSHQTKKATLSPLTSR
ncbi:hypothetical protein TNCV_3989821 [Trichonephila clavipes]|uniref:Uncharacterized protein n=1 Tax=Trichonephila clavipes TaxID=2585209 RepID=A0A8X6T0C7_TRICX|nr:hypothetical protein TNCV_3989821 [Trichonephila clavipes]